MDLGFTISVDAHVDELDILSLIHSNINGSEKIKGCIKLMGNVLQIEKNFDYDPHKVNFDEGWKFYKFDIDVFPEKESNIENQKKLLDSLCYLLERHDMKVKAFSEFDEQ